MGELKSIATSAGDALFKMNQAKIDSTEKKEITTKKGDSVENIQEAATDFEALLLSQMFKSMWKNVNQSGLSTSKEEETYREMFNDELAKDIAKGRGFGIKDIIVKELAK